MIYAVRDSIANAPDAEAGDVCIVDKPDTGEKLVYVRTSAGWEPVPRWSADSLPPSRGAELVEDPDATGGPYGLSSDGLPWTTVAPIVEGEVHCRCGAWRLADERCGWCGS